MPSPSPPSSPDMPSQRRRTSDRNVLVPITVPNNNADIRQRMVSAPRPASVPGNMRGMRRLEMRRGMEESHYLAQKARSSTLNAPVDLRMLDYVSEYDRNLMCPICRCPFVDPVVLCDCDHCFCRSCLNQAWTEYHPGGPRGSCPTCRLQTRLASRNAVSKILINILDELSVKCPKHEDGCTAEIKRGEVQDHINLYCSHSFVPCPRQDCEQPTRRKDASQCLHYGAACIDCHEHMFVDGLEHHWRRECPDRKIFCPHCQDEIYYRTLESHTSEICPAITAACVGSPYGCNVRSPRGDLDHHATTCIFARLAPAFTAQQKRMDEQEEKNKILSGKLEVFEKGFQKLEELVLDNMATELDEPLNPADPQQIPLVLEAAVRRQRQRQSRSTNQTFAEDAEGRVDEPAANVLPEIDDPAPPSGRASAMQRRLSTLSTSSDVYRNFRSHSTSQGFNYLTPTHEQIPFSAEGGEYTATPIQHLLSLHESLRDEVTRIAAALHDLDGRHSMLMLNDNMRLKEDMAFLNAQVAGLGRQVGWLTSSRLQLQSQPQNQAQSQSQSSQSQSQQQQGQSQSSRSRAQERDDDNVGDEAGDGTRGTSLGNGLSAVTALRGAARMVNLGASRPGEGMGFMRRAGSEEGRTKL